MAIFKIALSAGHGKYTAGKRCMKALDKNETREWVLNARIAEKIEKLLSAYTGYELLRLDDRTGETDIALSARSRSANAWGADLYLALHHNAGVLGGKGGGVVAYVYNKPSEASVSWQEDLYEAIVDATGLRGNRSTPLNRANFHECREPKAPSVLLELGFMDSKTDVPIILSEDFADKCATAIVNTIVKRCGLKKRGTTETVKVPEKTPVQATKIDYAKSGPSKLKSGTYVVKSYDGLLNMRAGASTDKVIVEVLKNGDKVKCYGYYTGAWLYVVAASGNKGFCHSSYLKKA